MLKCLKALLFVTLVDRYSESAKKITAVTSAISKDLDELDDQLQKLSSEDRNQYVGLSWRTSFRN